jgi:hypothetical protein
MPGNNITIRGTVVSVTGPKIYTVNIRHGKSKIDKDFYGIKIELPPGKEIEGKKFIDVYYPVNANVTHSKKGSIYSRKAFTEVYNKKNNQWISYQFFEPRKFVDFAVEITGNITVKKDGTLYMNHLSNFKVYLKGIFK